MKSKSRERIDQLTTDAGSGVSVFYGCISGAHSQAICGYLDELEARISSLEAVHTASKTAAESGEENLALSQ